MPTNFGDIPIAETVTVNPYDDIGDTYRKENGTTGPIPTLQELRMSRTGVAVGECSYAIECRDANPCTEDTCDILPGAPVGSGKCHNDPTPDGAPGACDDGVLCNGAETCSAGSCVSAGDPCTGGDVCSESLSRLNTVAGSLIAVCHPPCANDGECTAVLAGETLGCDGDETCGTLLPGVCEAGNNPCGPGADCLERVCLNCGPGCNNQRACDSNDDCVGNQGENGTCTGGLTCFTGRCCTTGDAGVTYACAAAKQSQCQGANKLWYAGDGGRLSTACGPTAGGCPKYGSGISPQGDLERLIGPVSASTVPVNAPNGPGVALHKLGDDYTLSNDPSFLNLRYVRLIGGMVTADRLSVEIYDLNQNFVQDFFFSMNDDIIAVRTVVFEPPIVIPSQGYVVCRIASRFSFEAEWVWMTTHGVDVGANDPSVLWVNDGPTTSFLDSGSGEVMAFELVGLGDPNAGGNDKTDAPIGACCNDTTGTCNDLLGWECRGAGDNFVGIGSTCASCGNDSALLGSPCRTCAGGANIGLACINDAECPASVCDLNNSLCSTCHGGSNEGDPCPLGTECLGGGTCSGTCELVSACTKGACCGLDGTCTEGETPGSCAGGICRLGTADGDACVDSSTCGGGTCVDRFQGYGLDCNPNCCYQPQDLYVGINGRVDPYTGGDSCEDAFVHNVTVVPGDPPTVITITGDNSNATNTQGDPDTCLNYEEDPESDRGWWESFSIDACAFVWWDVCCTTCDGGCQPGPQVMYDSCDPGNQSCPTNVISRINPNIPGLTRNFVRGLHSAPTDKFQGCEANDNITMFHGPLPAGTYYIPFLSDLASVNGQYQMHITIDPCPVANCCTTNIAGTASECTTLDILACTAGGGLFHGPPNRPDPVVGCAPGICDKGSCCTGPGACLDIDGLGDPFSISACNAESGKYVGGIPCAGGTCSNDNTVSCNDDTDCAPGTCIGDEAQLAQPNPCPVCEFQGLNNCQLYDDLEFGNTLPSDRGMQGGFTIADDFIPGGTTISKVCIWGFYLRVDDPSAPAIDPDCDDDVGGLDSFQVKIYENGANDLPGAVYHSSLVSTYVKTPLEGDHYMKDFSDDGPVDTYGIQMTLDSPVAGLNTSSTYWIEVTNNLIDFPDCNFWWFSLADGSVLGNRHSASAIAGPYSSGSEMRGDFTLCLEDDFAQPASPVRACCNCVDGVCQDLTLFDCTAARGAWHIDVATCAGGGDSICSAAQGPPDNDDCANMEVISSVPYRAFTNNFCATTDGFNPIESELGPASLGNDVWYSYTPDTDCDLTVSMCPSGTSYDSFVALYDSGTDGDPVCQCPVGTDLPTHALTFVESSDEGCSGELIGGPGIMYHPAKAGTCYLIRAGGFLSQGGAQGSGILDITCPPPPTAPSSPLPDPYSPGTLACGGGENYGLACETCDAGSRAGQKCLSSGDCPSGTCLPNNALCPGSTCGGLVAGVGTEFAYPKSRFIGFSTPADISWVGVEVGVRVILSNIGPNATCNGEVRYAGPPAQFCEGGTCATKFWASKLQATPFWMDWTTMSSIQLYGEEVVPGSRYAIQAIDKSKEGDLGNELNYSIPALVVDTAKWGDVDGPFAGYTAAGQPQIGDVLKVVDKWLGNLEPRKSRSQLQPAVINLSSTVGIADVLKVVDAWLSTPYPFTITTCTP